MCHIPPPTASPPGELQASGENVHYNPGNASWVESSIFIGKIFPEDQDILGFLAKTQPMDEVKLKFEESNLKLATRA